MDEITREGLRAVGQLDKAAEGSKARMPEYAKDAIAYGIATVVDGSAPVTVRMKLACAICSNLFHAGYLRGTEAAKTQLGAGEG